ncbi:LPS-assembly protein LptD [Paracoccus sp. p3-h83]|uniref:LPS-assembly protein LptD n=1 Tax=Paracoccus sp. p3-h83 TaxID=3342805 RepID=UPI0035BB4B24
MTHPPIIRNRLLTAALASLIALAQPASAQDTPATLVADRVQVQDGSLLTATGDVQMFHQGRRLTATGVTYDQARGTIRLTGPIRLTEPGADGSVLIADQAELDADLRDGILTGARMLMARELQLAAARITRSQGRFTTFDRVVASSCEVCVSAPTPLWEIRAAQVRHDAETRRLTFHDAQLRAFGVPVGWVPQLSLPDPTVSRAAGLLRPGFRSTSKLGFGISLPVFVPLGDHHDLTLTPSVTTKNSRTLGLRGRHALTGGLIEWSGALTRDRLRPGELRGYLFGTARFALPRDYRLGVQVQTTSDPDYLSDYAISDADRLWSGVTIDRVRRDRMVFAAIGNFHTLRAGETNSTQPAQVAGLAWERRWPLAGGEAGLRFDMLAFRRSSDAQDIGRDMTRLGLRADWRRQWLLPQGVVVAGELRLAADQFLIGDDASYDAATTRIDPTAAVELRWPWLRRDARGAAQVIEPVARLDLSRNRLPDVPDEDSRLAEFDEANLFAPSRFPGGDARETGQRLALGVAWTQIDPRGWSLGLAGGRIWRLGDARPASGSELARGNSDWLIAAHASAPGGLRWTGRALLGDGGDVNRAETRIAWANDRLDLSAGYLWQTADAYENRAEDLSELVLDGRFAIGGGWRAGLSGRYDFDARQVERAGLAVSYVNECVTVDLSLSHRRTSSTTVSRDTDVGLSVRLTGFGAGGGTGSADRAVRRRCLR